MLANLVGSRSSCKTYQLSYTDKSNSGCVEHVARNTNSEKSNKSFLLDKTFQALFVYS